jgi:hypothetical protein
MGKNRSVPEGQRTGGRGEFGWRWDERASQPTNKREGDFMGV